MKIYYFLVSDGPFEDIYNGNQFYAGPTSSEGEMTEIEIGHDTIIRGLRVNSVFFSDLLYCIHRGGSFFCLALTSGSLPSPVHVYDCIYTSGPLPSPVHKSFMTVSTVYMTVSIHKQLFK